jgi:hypothetical protein
MGLLPELSSGKERRTKFAVSVDSSKVGSQSSWKISIPQCIGKRFPDEVYHRLPARQYAPDHLQPRRRPQSLRRSTNRKRDPMSRAKPAPAKNQFRWIAFFESDEVDGFDENARFLTHFPLVFDKFRG